MGERAEREADGAREIAARIMAEMEEVLDLIRRPIPRRPDAPVDPGPQTVDKLPKALGLGERRL